MKLRIGFVLLLALPLVGAAAITGTVVNKTTGKPQAGAKVGMFKFGPGGMQPVTEVTADAQGNFSVDASPSAQGPTMLRVEVDDVTYNHLMPPGSPATGIAINVYNASKEPAGSKITRHMILLQPVGGEMTVNETYVMENPGKTTWFDKANGTLHFWLPASVKGQPEVNGTAPDGLPVPVPTAKTARADVYQAKFEVKPGQTRFDLVYTVPYKESEAYSGKVATKDDNTYLIAPNGVTLVGENLKDMGTEPRTKARIYGLTGTSYQVKLTGTLTPATDAGAEGDAEGGPKIEQIMPRLYGKAPLIVGLALGILALGFALLYRAAVPSAGAPSGPARETHERGRR